MANADQGQGVSRRAVFGTASALVLLPTLASPPAQARSGPAPIIITAIRIETFSKLSAVRNFGRLTFHGGLVLKSTDPAFGGFSGLALEPDGVGCLAITDEGCWLTADLGYAGTSPAGLHNARLGPLLSQSGRPLTRKRDADAEAVALVEGDLTRGTALVAFERNHRVGRYPIVDRALQAPTGFLRMPADARLMKPNKGLEAMTVLTGGRFKGAVIAYSERFPALDGTHTGWIWLDGEPQRMGLVDIEDFEITDAAALADGRLIILERRFRWTEGVKLRLRLLAAREIGPGLVARGEVLLAADLTSEIDNMEGVAVHRSGDGKTILTLISDDNFNAFLQRTVLLQFALSDGV